MDSINTATVKTKSKERRNIYSIVALVLAAVIATTTVLSILMAGIYNDVSNQIDIINTDHAAEIVDLNTEHENEITQLNSTNDAKTDQLINNFNTELATMSADKDTIAQENARLWAENEELKKEIAEEDTREFSLFKKYYYVLRNAPDNGTWTMDLIEHIDRICQEKDINPHLIYGVIYVESRYDIYAVSSAGARGMCQFMPSTGKWIYENVMGKGAGTYDHVTMCTDPFINSEMCVTLLRQLLDEYNNNIVRALAHYNGSSGDGYYQLVKKAMKDVGQDVDSLGYR